MGVGDRLTNFMFVVFFSGVAAIISGIFLGIYYGSWLMLTLLIVAGMFLFLWASVIYDDVVKIAKAEKTEKNDQEDEKKS